MDSQCRGIFMATVLTWLITSAASTAQQLGFPGASVMHHDIVHKVSLSDLDFLGRVTWVDEDATAGL